MGEICACAGVNSNPPIVALGAGLLEGGKLLLGVALLGMFALAVVSGIVQKRLATDEH